jgi:hypothetical protein
MPCSSESLKLQSNIFPLPYCLHLHILFGLVFDQSVGFLRNVGVYLTYKALSIISNNYCSTFCSSQKHCREKKLYLKTIKNILWKKWKSTRSSSSQYNSFGLQADWPTTVLGYDGPSGSVSLSFIRHLFESLGHSDYTKFPVFSCFFQSLSDKWNIILNCSHDNFLRTPSNYSVSSV